ncbi:Cupin domain protein [Halomicrobium zhouii]|uniref:Cupin domain protein n=1 Tax=Halomicrobium zhouii TaxID=767519 RepID=A0A1I6K1M2_9EURY|nr:cupin domain-containing protein [Halomicrobium zhouii]SFR85152.1 Cupin domain protein [Halomicrobium zhouii]
MVATDFTSERAFEDDRFRASVLHESDSQKVVMGYFRPGQFIPVHAPDSQVAITVHSGKGVVREGETDHHVEPGSVVVVPAGEKRGVRAETELQATLVTAPPPGEAAHEPVRRGLERDEFEPELE